ncbi:hypothetical protein SAMN05421846_10898 [Chryseobacterium taeanense]|uniref:Histidine kinase-, DNA gyrase B-, and HSP90-like ATPase n=1 Tax=Chryseobacterium taeanense TaxID=311334 RepID=A0A1G8KYE6_9FLAO|nr:sensor histidine kinase [Chryseobacterium taeanense]SDI47910.1 hypothetical protein SAMN05421846_10898 [Chryseobacterium taeanense]
MVLYKFPSDIKSNYDGYNYFSHIIELVKILRNEEVIFDFDKVTFFQANLCSLFGVCLEILKENNNIFKIININNQVETILRKNNFLVELGYQPINDNYATSLKYMRFVPRDDEGFNEYIITQLLNKKDFPVISKPLHKEILRNIFEIYENARTHGKCDYIHACGQFFPKPINKPLHFTLVDKGINIKENVALHLGIDIEASDAIEWAMVKGNTTKKNESGGLGLAVIFEFIKLNGGSIQIVSADGYYEVIKGNVRKQRLTSYFGGTIVTLIFNFNDKNSYSLVNEENDLSNPF